MQGLMQKSSVDSILQSKLTEANFCCLERNYDGAAEHYQIAAELSESSQDKDAYCHKSLQASALCDLP